MNSPVLEYFKMIAAYSPVLLAYAIGAGVAVFQLKKHPRPALFVLLAALIHLFASLAHPAITMAIMHADSSSMSDRASLFTVVGLIFGFIHIISFALLVAAAFVRRSSPPAVPFTAPYSG